MSQKYRRLLIYRRLRILALLVAGAGAVFGGVLWFQDAPLREAQQLLADGRSEAAVQAIRAWERSHRPTGRSQALLGRSLVEAGDFRSAIRIFETVAAANAAEIHAWAKAYLSLHQWSNALPLLKELRKREPDDADVIHELAACQAKLGLLDEALKTADEFKLHEEYAHRAWLLIGVINLQRGNKTAAIEAWTKIASYDPDYSDLQLSPEEFLTQFASLYLELGQAQKASELLSQSLAIRETAEAQFQAGLAADLSGNPTTAKRCWQRAVELDPVHRNARESLARLAIAAGETDEAAAILEPIVSQGLLRSSTTYLLQRVAQLQRDSAQAAVWQQQTEQLRRQEAIDSAVNRLLVENPNSYWAQVVRSYQFAERGNFHQAQRLLDRIQDANEDPFVADLRVAVATRRQLPEKYRIPIKHF